MGIKITIKKLEKKTYPKVKSKGAEEKKKGKTFLYLLEKPNDWGVKTDSSEDIDQYIYQ